VTLEGPDERLKGTPAIVPSRRACVVCDDLSCMPACPSGALVRLSVDDFRIGLAVVDAASCVRTRGEDCRACVDGCPIGSRAIALDAEGAVTIGSACVGCGVCEMVCPTRPRAVVVRALAGG
jgi:NAD-dependent dihydropyrimidine dehydrogenase PreA subunit